VHGCAFVSLTTASQLQAVEHQLGAEEYERALLKHEVHLSSEHWNVLRTEGSMSLTERLQQEKEANLPEFLKRRPK
jgi:hypothetical protein